MFQLKKKVTTKMTVDESRQNDELLGACYMLPISILGIM